MPKHKPPAPPFVEARWHGAAQTPALIVMHSTVSPCQPGQAMETARYFQETTRPASAHYCVDPSAVVQTVGDHVEAFHCGYNHNSIGVEMCDMPGPVPSDSRTSARFKALRRSWRWLRPAQQQMLSEAAALVAQLCLAYDIPVRWCGEKQLRAWDIAKRPADGGITTHALMSRTFHRSTHWDPGFWPRRKFLRMVAAEVKRQSTPSKARP